MMSWVCVREREDGEESRRNREGTNTKNSVKFPGREQVNMYGGHVLHVGVHTLCLMAHIFTII